MVGNRIIKIFLASSSESEADRKEFEIFINRKNKEYIKQSIFLELVIWEDFLDAMSATRLQDEYNKAIANCDVFVSLFKTKVGQYTEEEFSQAFETFQTHNRPLIYTYFQDSEITINQVDLDDLISLKNFKDKLSRLGHFYTPYKNIYDLKLHFSEQLIKFLPSLGGNIKQSPYINRPPIEENCFQGIRQDGALLRIKASARMGKTLLLEQILDYASRQSYKTVKLDFQLTDRSVLTDLKTFLQWFCVSVADSLDLDDKLDQYWRDIYGLNRNCSRYFQKYLLSVIDSPLVLALDNFELLFGEQDIFEEFCLLLRGWYESAKQGERVGKLWKKLRLIVVYSTDDYSKLKNINHSPFNVGVMIEPTEFNQPQVTDLAQLYELELDLQSFNSLVRLVGGNPYLVNQAFNCLKNQSLSLEKLLQEATTEEGIYSDHLHQILWALQQNPSLKAAFEQVITSSTPVLLDTERGFKLKSMGLVKASGDDYLTSCDLYRQYFAKHIQDMSEEDRKIG